MHQDARVVTGRSRVDYQIVPENGGSEILCRSFLVARRHLDSSPDSYSSLLNDLARHAGRITVPLPPSNIRIPEDPLSGRLSIRRFG